MADFPADNTTRKEDRTMADIILKQTEEWFARHRQEIIRCPYQPGNLMITRSGCKKRRDRARRESYDDITKGDFFQYIYKSGLMVCRDCRLELEYPSKGGKVIPFHRQGHGAATSITRTQRVGT
jgi:hypothetical protein